MVLNIDGYDFTIDDEDYSKVKDFKWHVLKSKRHGLVYAIAYVQKTAVLMHRLVMGMAIGNGLFVDHINRDTTNNHKSNLRVVSHGQNMMNCKMHSNNQAGYKGVSMDGGRLNPWKAQIRINGKKVTLGRFPTPEQAYEAYCLASIKFHGEYGRVQ
jgi:hypothetical protein